MVLGGAPWRVLRIAPAGRPFLRRLAAATAGAGVAPPGVEQALADLLSAARGIVHPVAPPYPGEGAVRRDRPGVRTTAPAGACLVALRETVPGARLIVVDDASATIASRRWPARTARSWCATGSTVWAAARNTGLREATSPIVAFVDADCAVTTRLDRSAARAFRRSPGGRGGPADPLTHDLHRILVCYEDARSALDMGPTRNW